MTEELIKHLASINSRINALLAIEVNKILTSGDGGTRDQRGLERLLSDAGLGTSEIARLFGKTPRAIQKAIAKEKGTQRTKTENGASDGEET